MTWIGRAIAERRAANGAAVAIDYTRNRQLAREVVDGILPRGGKAVAIQAEDSKPAEVRRLFNEAVKVVGPLDIVVANAGVVLERPLVESTEADYESVFDINADAAFYALVASAWATHLSPTRVAVSRRPLALRHRRSAA